MNGKYKMFKNFMHNELEITKEDIKGWVLESVQSEVKKVVDEAYGKFNIKKVIEKRINEILLTKPHFQFEKLKDSVYTELSKEVFKKYDVNMILKKVQLWEEIV